MANFNKDNTMTLIIFTSAFLLTFGIVQVKEAIDS